MDSKTIFLLSILFFIVKSFKWFFNQFFLCSIIKSLSLQASTVLIPDSSLLFSCWKFVVENVNYHCWINFCHITIKSAKESFACVSFQRMRLFRWYFQDRIGKYTMYVQAFTTNRKTKKKMKKKIGFLAPKEIEYDKYSQDMWVWDT